MIVAAERHFREAIRLRPQEPAAHYWAAEALCYQGRLPEAVPFAVAALQLDAQVDRKTLSDAERAHLHTRIGEGLLLEDERHDEAAAHLEQAVALTKEQKYQPLSSPSNLLQGLRAQSTAERARRFARWPIPLSHFADIDRAAEEMAAAVPRLDPALTKSSRVAALGSCFAMNLAHELARYGVATSIMGMGELINSTFANRALFEWALDDATPMAEPGVADVLMAYFGSDKNEVLRNFREADVFIYTLGVAPAFFDRASGRFHLAQPGASTRHLLRTKQFRTTTVAENADNIEYIAEAITRLQPQAQIVFSVSPVPLFATFEYDSAVIADCVSKSTLRVAIDLVMKKGRSNIHYWPAFEIVRWLGVYDGHMYGSQDGTSRHVSEHAIQSVVRAFVLRHGDESVIRAIAGE
jgi:tetratricopeptide (TPR) repeat protein